MYLYNRVENHFPQIDVLRFVLGPNFNNVTGTAKLMKRGCPMEECVAVSGLSFNGFRVLLCFPIFLVFFLNFSVFFFVLGIHFLFS